MVPPHFLNSLDSSYQSQNKPPNVIVVVFDAFSTFDASLYGYERVTTAELLNQLKQKLKEVDEPYL